MILPKTIHLSEIRIIYEFDGWIVCDFEDFYYDDSGEGFPSDAYDWYPNGCDEYGSLE